MLVMVYFTVFCFLLGSVCGSSIMATAPLPISPSMTTQFSVTETLPVITPSSSYDHFSSSTDSPQGLSSMATPYLPISPSMTTQFSVTETLPLITASSVNNYLSSSTASSEGTQLPSTKQPYIHQGPRYTFGCLENGNVVVKGVSSGANITIVGDQCKNKTQTSSGSSITIEAICLSSQIFTSNRTVTFTIKDEVFDGNRSAQNTPLINGGQNSHVFTVNCQSLTDRGMNVYIVHGMGVINSATVKIPTEIETVRMRIKSDVYSTRDDVTDLPDMSSVYIGDKFYLYLVYNGKDKYKIVPTKCTAFEGAYAAEPASSVSNVLLWTRDGCISDPAISYRLMHNFKTMTNDSRVVYAEMFGFQFHSSTEITFLCEVKICKPGDGSTDCILKSDQTCRDESKWTAKRRKRESNHDGGFKVMGKIQIESQFTDYRSSQDNSAGVLQINWMYLIATYIFLQIKWHII
ncbi:uncharacterized protein LOC134723209 isoform X2 [Mytilus trossulus]|uniref:uncharacterized protein LOC134723209 isoform X2 n=1 Tax=Mytilus trossulus TaxID=6551 RepID=UPI003006E477